MGATATTDAAAIAATKRRGFEGKEGQFLSSLRAAAVLPVSPVSKPHA